MADLPIADPEIVAIIERLAPLRKLAERISREPRPITPYAAAALIQRYRPEMYAAMFDLGAAIHRFEQTQPSPERLADAIQAVRRIGLAWFPTNPLMATGHRGVAQRLPYYEMVELIRATFPAPANLASILISDYAASSIAGQTFRNRLELAKNRLQEEVAQRVAAGYHPIQLYSLHYLGGSELLHLADDSARMDGLRITCLDAAPAAVRHAEQTLEPSFRRRITFQLADPERWLNGPACPREEACIVYCVSLLEQVDAKSVVRILRGVYNLLREGGVFIMGSVTPAVPIEEQRLRAWVMSWDWRYRNEAEWRDLFAQTPFRPEDLTFGYEPLRGGAGDSGAALPCVEGYAHAPGTSKAHGAFEAYLFALRLVG